MRASTTDIAAPLGLSFPNRDVRIKARAAFSEGTIGEVDIRNSQTSTLVVGASGSGFGVLVTPSTTGSRGGIPQAVALSALSVNGIGYSRLMGIVKVMVTGTVAKGDLLTVDDKTAGRRYYGIALSASSGGYCTALWDGVRGFGQIMAVGGGGGNNPPAAALTATPSSGDKPLAVTLDASGSTDDSSITKYEFDYGEGGGWVDNGTTATKAHTYTVSGTYTASVRVTDDGSPALQDIATAVIVVTAPSGTGVDGTGSAGGEDGNGQGSGQTGGGVIVGH